MLVVVNKNFFIGQFWAFLSYSTGTRGSTNEIQVWSNRAKWSAGTQSFIYCHSVSQNPAISCVSAVTVAPNNSIWMMIWEAVGRQQASEGDLKTCMSTTADVQPVSHAEWLQHQEHHLHSTTDHINTHFHQHCFAQQRRIWQVTGERIDSSELFLIRCVADRSATATVWLCTGASCPRYTHSPWRSPSDGSGRACGPGRSR